MYRNAVVLSLVLGLALDARALTVVTVGKSATFRTRDGVASARIQFGKDPALATLADPTCAGGGVVSLQVAAYPQATARVDAQDEITLPCAGWKRTGEGFVYKDAAGTMGGVRKVVYGRRRFAVELRGDPYRHVAGPVGYVELWVNVGTARLLTRFHSFRKNGADLVVTRKPSAAAAAGEAGFWAILHGDATPTTEETTLKNLTKAVRRDERDGRPPFLLGMLYLYRFGQATTSYLDADAAAEADLVAANEWFAKALPLLWDGASGDSRVPGFVAAAKFGLGVVQNDLALQAQGLADLEAAVAVNAFFNVFDLVPVAQATTATDPRFAEVFGFLKSYIGDPDTLSCVVTQPEICADRGLAPRNVAGALMLFGDLYAKAGGLDPANVTQAETWYAIAAAVSVSVPGYRFADAVTARVGQAAERAALYQDADPANDPPLIGAAAEACAVCHYR